MAAVGLGISMLIFKKKGDMPFDTAVAGKTDIVLEVASTGRVQPTDTVEVAFEMGGRVKSVAKKVGNRVAPGETLLSLDNSELYAQKAQAQAQVKAAQALLSELKAGVRPEELQIKRTALENAERSLVRSQEQFADAMRDAYVKADDAVRNKADELFSNPRTNSPVFTSVVSNIGARGDIEQKRVMVEEALVSLADIVHGSDNAASKAVSKKVLLQTGLFLDSVAFAINNDVSPNIAVSQGMIEGWRFDIASARAAVSAAVNNMTAAEQSMASAESAVRLAKSEIALAEAGTDEHKIRAQEANVESAEAQVDALAAQIEKTVVRSPISGVIAKQDVRVGESVSGFSPAVTIISDAQFEIETFVPEADIAFVRVGLPAEVTLDAYTPEDFFPAKVATIDPTETIIEGVATYKVTLLFVEKDERVRSGMTANITIESNKREDVLAVPLRAVISKDSKEYVRVVEGKTYREIAVTTGLHGSDGMVEIVRGITEGDMVVTFLKNESDQL